MVRFFVEQAYNAEMKYVEAMGLSKDTKPSGNFVTGSKFLEVDTAKLFRMDEESGEWLLENASGTPITGATVTLGSSLTYNGSEQTQAVSSVVLGETTLTADTDYYVVKNKATDAGTYTLYIIGKGSYSGVITKEFTVSKANGSVTASPDSLSLTPDGDDGTATLTVSGDGELSVSSSDKDVATAVLDGTTVTVTPGEAGSATITITMADSANYNGATETISVTVAEAEDDNT